MLAVFVFAVIAWITEAVSYEVSSVTIVALIALRKHFRVDEKTQPPSMRMALP